MSRGAQRTTRQLTDRQLAQQNSQIAQENQSDAQDRSLLMPTIQGPTQQSGIHAAAAIGHHAAELRSVEHGLRRPA
jgi:hypothetical protein